MGVDHTYRYVNATNVYNKGKANGGTCTLLWTNPNPNSIGNFDPQTISINLTNYDGVIILGKYFATMPSGIPTKSNFDGQSYIGYVWKGFNSTVDLKCYDAMRRITSCSNTGVGIEHGYIISSGGVNDSIAIPCKIWGVKHGGVISF